MEEEKEEEQAQGLGFCVPFILPRLRRDTPGKSLNRAAGFLLILLLHLH